MLRAFFKIVRYFPFYFTLYKDFRRIKRYSTQLLGEVKPLFVSWDKVVDTENQKRMRDYILIQTMWTAGFCLLRGERIKDNELKAIVNISALAPLYDDFFDKVDMPGDKINALVNTPFEYSPDSDIERLFIEFSGRIHENVKDVPFYLLNAKRVFKAQFESKRLVSDAFITEEEIKRIAFEKGASTVVCMCNMLNKRLSDQESIIMNQLGGVAQYLDDIFDLREDFEEGRKTLANPIGRVAEKRKDFIKEVNMFKKLLNGSNYRDSNKNAFLFPVTFILGATLLCLDRYEMLEKRTGTFEIKKYLRKELVVDMDLLSNRIKAFKLSSKL